MEEGTIEVLHSTCFDGSGCEPVQQMSPQEADRRLIDSAGAYAGWGDCNVPGFVFFARPGTVTFAMPGRTCHLYRAPTGLAAAPAAKVTAVDFALGNTIYCCPTQRDQDV